MAKCLLIRLPGRVRDIVVRWAPLLALGLLLQACDEPQAPMKIRVGQVVPPLAVQDLQSRPVTLKPNPGKLLMINVWATWCTACRHEMPSLQRLVDEIGHERLDLVGLSVDQDEYVVREYLIEHKISFPSLLDHNLVASSEVLGVQVFPTTFFLNPDGTLVRIIVGSRDWDLPEMLVEIRSMLPAVEIKPVQRSQSDQAGP